jgi:hypothetical protein
MIVVIFMKWLHHKLLRINIRFARLSEVLLFEMETEMFKGCFCIVTGCEGDCPGCFQMNYCDMKNEF